MQNKNVILGNKPYATLFGYIQYFYCLHQCRIESAGNTGLLSRKKIGLQDLFRCLIMTKILQLTTRGGRQLNFKIHKLIPASKLFDFPLFRNNYNFQYN